MLLRTALASALVVTACAPPCEPQVIVVDGGASAPLRCEARAWSPWTLEAGRATEVEVLLRCTGGDETTSDVTLDAALVRDDGTKLPLQLAAKLGPGEVPLRFTVPPLAYSAQPLTLLVDDGGRFSLPTSTRIDFRLHLPASAVEAQGGGALFRPPAPTPGATLVAHHARDLDGDDALDLLLAWRAGDTLTLETWRGPAPTKGASSTVSGLAGALVGEPLLVRRRDSTSDRKASLLWSVLDGSTGRLQLTRVDLSDGVPSPGSRFSDAALPAAEALLGVDVVFESAAPAAGAAPEAIVLYRGVRDGNRVFVAAVTESATSKLQPLATLPSLDAVTADAVATGTASAGLVRSWKVRADLRDGVDRGNVLAWTVAMTPGGAQLELHALTTGAKLGAVTFMPAATERDFDVRAIDVDGDGTSDLLLSSTDEGRPVARWWRVSATGVLDPLPRELRFPPRARFHEGRRAFHDSKQAPWFLAAARPGSGPHLVGVDVVLTLGELDVPATVGWSATEAHPAFLAPMATPGEPERTRLSTARGATISRTADGALTFGRRAVDDSVTLASHPKGAALVLSGAGGGTLRLRTPYAREREVPEWRCEDDALDAAPLLFDDETTPGSTLLVLRRAEANGDVSWRVWRATPTSFDGPGTLVIPAALGHFEPLAAAGTSLHLARAGRGGRGASARFESAALPVSTLTTLAHDRQRLTLAQTDLRVLEGADAEFPARGPATWRTALRVRRQEAELKRRLSREREAGRVAQPGDTEVVTVIAAEEADPCPFKTVLLTAAAAPVTLSESAQPGCLDLDVPVAAADFCGIGGQQVLTVNAGTDDTWEFQLWMRAGTRASAVRVGATPRVGMTHPRVSAADVNGDGAADVVVHDAAAPSVFFNDGRGGSFGGASMGGVLELAPMLPAAGVGLEGGSVACGAGLECQYVLGTRPSCGQANNRAELL
ncbi:MAG: hypothetical protein ACOZQL_09595 [Myxococcota bacterium]